jgi:beta-lactam-binding protein with PASTA domain
LGIFSARTPDQPVQPCGQMPMVVGLRLEIAKAAIRSAAHEPAITVEEAGDRASPGCVAAQVPDPGTPLERGCLVTLTVSRQP